MMRNGRWDQWYSNFFSRMRSEGFSFYIWGVWGWRRVRVTLLLVSATVRNRLRTAIVAEKLPCPWGEATKTCLSPRVRRCAHVVLCGRRGTWWHWMCFSRNVCVCVRDRRGRKVAVSMGKATKTCLSRRVRRCAHVVLCGRRGAWWRWMCSSWNGDRRGRKVIVSMRESHQNVSFSTCQKMCSCRFVWQAWHLVTLDVFQPECVCVCARPSWQKSCRVYGESHQNVSFSTCQKMCSCRFVWQAWRLVTLDVFQLEWRPSWQKSCRVYAGKPPKRVFLDVSEDVLMSFCVAGVALGDIGCVSAGMATVVAEKLSCLCGKLQKRVFLDVSEDVLMSFCVAGVALGDIGCVSAGMCACDRRI